MIRTLSLVNFKSWKNLNELNFGRITLFFGENSSGKTSILQSILMLKQTAESFDRAQPLNLGAKDSLVDLGLYEELIYGHDSSLPLRLKVSWDSLSEELKIIEPAEVDLEFRFKAETIRIQKTKVRLGKVKAELVRSGERGAYELLYQGESTDIPKSKELTPIKCYGFPPVATQHYPDLNDLSLAVDNLAHSIYFLGPLRIPSQREYQWSGSAPGEVGRSGESAIQAILANIVEREAMKKAHREKVEDLVKCVQKWLQQMNLAKTFAVDKIKGTRQYKAMIQPPSYQYKANVADVGIGVSQVLPVIVLAYFAPAGSTIVFEQPELHLHPSAQAKLADFLYEVSQEREIQFIVETHSEYLLTRLQRRIAERDSRGVGPADIQLYFCKRENDQSIIDRLQIDDSGRIINWPKNFFGDALSDREAIMNAFMQRRKEMPQL